MALTFPMGFSSSLGISGPIFSEDEKLYLVHSLVSIESTSSNKPVFSSRTS